MDEKFFDQRPGEYYLYEDPGNYHKYYTYTPNLLCDDLDIKIDAELASLLSTAHRLLGQLEGMSSFLPNIAAVESIFLYKESLLSCQIDGVTAPIYNVLDASKNHDKKVQPIKNYVSANNHGMNVIRSSGYKNTLLCEIHKMLSNMNNEDCGRFRTNIGHLGKVLVSSNLPGYNPTAPDKLPFLLFDLEAFLRNKKDIDAIIKAALAHYQFETIHPFMSKNGCVGRILSYLVLCEEEILTRPIISLSYNFNANKIMYFDRIAHLQEWGDYLGWIKFYVKSIIFAADDSLQKIKRWLNIREKNLAGIDKLTKPIKAIKEVYDIVEQYPILDVKVIAEKSGISYNTAATALESLTELKIMKQSNDMARNRDYAYTEFLDCFMGEDLPWRPDDCI